MCGGDGLFSTGGFGLTTGGGGCGFFSDGGFDGGCGGLICGGNVWQTQ